MPVGYHCSQILCIASALWSTKTINNQSIRLGLFSRYPPFRSIQLIFPNIAPIHAPCRVGI